jgi:ATPase subunit of ABC transporter with duplicated ATPase domains
MIHKPIQIKNLSLVFPHKTCFEDFSVQVPYGSRIAIIGRNGCGKTTLLKIVNGMVEPTSGDVLHDDDVRIGFVPQIVEDFDSLSGGQRLNAAITKALSRDPNALLLDEPTNHLDRSNRKSLMRMLQSYPGTLMVISHDTEFLRHCIDTLWHIDEGEIRVFSGNYDDYIREIHNYRYSLTQEITRLDRQKKEMHRALMKEQKRAAKSKAKGEKSIHQRKWPTIVSTAKASKAEDTSGRKQSAIDHKKDYLTEQLSNLRLPKIIGPKFSLSSTDIGERTIVSISDGSVGYAEHKPLLQNINLSIGSKAKVAIQGGNACGKSTLIKGILHDSRVIKSGNWHVPKISDIGYLDQHYNTLSAGKTVLETISELAPTWPHTEVRRHLNDFLFCKNEEVYTLVSTLSGGEKVRLSLAQIAAKTPKLLILDEITNNLDLETKAHVVQVLKAYPGAIIVIAHDADFLKEAGINEMVDVQKFTESKTILLG